jgi:hypothetical protein
MKKTVPGSLDDFFLKKMELFMLQKMELGEHLLLAFLSNKPCIVCIFIKYF